MSLQANKALGTVLKIRESRQMKAIADLNKARDWQKECEAQVETNKQKLREYYDWRIEYQQQMFAEKKGSLMSFNELAEYRARLSAMLEREPEILAEIRQAEKQVQGAMQKLQKAKQLVADMVKAKEKINELIVEQKKAIDRELAYREEQETEEYTDRSYTPPR